jgi:unsaturated rhamnogalacturonyl hydrolase
VTAASADTADGAGSLGLDSRIRGAADILSHYGFACWRYGDSIGFEGLVAGTALTSDARYVGFVTGAIKAWIPRSKPFVFWDNTAPGHAMCLAYEQSGDEAIVAAALELAEYLRGRRTYRGAYVAFERTPLHSPSSGERLDSHGLSLLADPGAGVFVDCMHFDPPFLAHLGHLTGSPELLNDAATQACAMIDLLQDETTGLFSHFVLERAGQTYGLGWSRGQGWALLGMLDVLSYLPDQFEARSRIMDSVQKLGDALARSQDASGHWRGRIGDPDSYPETSAALFFAAGVWRGVRLGVLDDALLPMADRAWSAAMERVSASGAIEGVSAAVWPSPHDSHYRGVPIGFQVPWGQGPLLLAAEERARRSVQTHGGTRARDE